ncbi:class II fumarate hydratase, partial [Candidatus Bathyarchaeota archaeon]|nr:class II fumarate hydratase [Candidatus Bathyarchaeota archaeon]
RALAIVKLAACKANWKLGLLDERKANAIAQAAWEVVEGRFDDMFPLDVFQTGSGTSTNMNMNEVIANRAAEILGGRKGDSSLVHPNDDVNMSQSTNDVFPTAIHLASLKALRENLLPNLEALALTLRRKATEFEDIVKPGRTHLQDAVPVTLGQEFGAYATMIDEGIRRIRRVENSLAELPIGATAVGTGLNADPRFAQFAIEEINRITGLNFRMAKDRFEALMARNACVELSGALRGIAISFMKIANDLRLMASGPRTGLAEIELPALQPGSSIMPGKVNPVVPEVVCMVAAQILGKDLTIAIAGQSGLLELNVMMPIIALNLLESIELLANAARLLGGKCIAGIKANRKRCLEMAERSLALVTALTPIIGYEKAAMIVHKAIEEEKSLREVVIEEGLLTEEEAQEILDPRRLVRGGRLHKGRKGTQA